MKLFGTPLICLALGDSDAGLLGYVRALARHFQWHEIHFLHVAEPAGAWNPEPLKTRMSELIAPLFPGINLVFHVRQGPRLDGIMGTVLESHNDLILLGHRKERSGRRSLALRTVLMAPASVWMVPEGSAAAFGRILVPTDFSSFSAEALNVAVQVADATGSRHLQALHVYFDPSTLRYEEHAEQVLGEEETAFEHYLASVETGGMQVEPLYQEGARASKAILRVAEEQGSDLLIMNTRGRNRASFVLLGSTTAETLTGTAVPILVVKHHGAALSLLEALRHPAFLERRAPKAN